MEQNDGANLREKIVSAVRAKEPTETEAWQDLSVLASAPRVDAIETFEDEIQIEGTAFSGALLWYVTLTYGPPDDEVVSSESFPGKFEGHMTDGLPSIDRMTIDTSSFYA
jgi:hypothetical protein